MIKRRLYNKIVRFLKKHPAVALIGPRQVGKTTLAVDISRSCPSVYLDLEDPVDAVKVQDIKTFHHQNRDKLIILDEVQRTPGIFAPIRGIIDAERRAGNDAGQFLFLGSASIELLKQSSESLAGRIAYVELHPVDVTELFSHNAKQDTHTLTNKLWLRGGIPKSLLAGSDEDSLDWRKFFITTYLERDIPLLGPHIPAETLRRLWTMLVHSQGSTLNAAKLAGNIGMSGQTVSRYLDLLVELLLVRRLQPWSSNEGKRLVRSPKIFLRDSGIGHALLNIKDCNDLLGHPAVGGSWEGFVIENLLSVAPQHVFPFFYRTAGGAEIDLVLEFSSKEKWAIEMKRNSVPSVSKGFYLACEDIQVVRKYVVYAGQDTFLMGNDVTAISLSDLMQEIMKQT